MEQREPIAIYHIGDEREVSIREIAHLVAAASGREIRIVPGQLQPGSTSRRCPDVRKLKRLGFEPMVSLEDGVRRTAAWYVSHS
jgi:UDP-glucose 4-epimerase